MNCSEGEPYINHVGFRSVVLSQVLFSLIGIVINVIYLSKHFNYIHFHANIKILIATSILMNLTHSVIYVILQGTHFVLFATSETGCDCLVPVWFCLIMRGIAVFAMVSFVTLNVAIVFERFAATIYVATYEHWSNQMGVMLTTISLGISLLITYISQKDQPISGFSPYCSGTNEYTARITSICSYVMTAVETLAIFVFAKGWYDNKKLRRSRRFKVSVGFQVSENLSAFSLLLPWMSMHYVISTLFYLSMAIIPFTGSWTSNLMNLRTMISLAYILPIYCILSPILLWRITIRQRRHRAVVLTRLSTNKNETENYYQQYNRYWR